ncbi:thioesterase family protein [Rhodococcus sp. PAMC28707]|uniref:acyl-CoA thioesterase n=1 Tax=unclassified Rhodococcus (in: high G+C Gram-positive bacteria) TaxID=192944 RepID=UPI00109DF557|nr:MULTISPECIES: thioesterase family protein [unclassified Rhodococcus (in: high G+C Gram-positive bacteria)]QCB51889.1 thioesterase family protein [Rhodococcus sp. PAMC28705]QCB59941.1 thioesterase family protein [Rhodococcus sp. PAMC28707]
MTDTHPFDDALTLEAVRDGVVRGHTSTAYKNMVGPFGGLTAATLIRAVEKHPDRLGEPISITINFAGPVSDGAFEISTRAVRTNRSNQHWYLELSQGGVVATTATAVFGSRRETWNDVEASSPAAPAPSDLEAGGFPDFIAWAKNYEMHFAAGKLSEEETVDSTATLWVRDAPPRQLDFASLTSMCDVFYPRVFQRRGKFVPAGTISLTIHYFATAADLATQAEGHLLGTAHSRRFNQGYFDQSAELWGTDGNLLATSHQVVYYKD